MIVISTGTGINLFNTVGFGSMIEITIAGDIIIIMSLYWHVLSSSSIQMFCPKHCCHSVTSKFNYHPCHHIPYNCFSHWLCHSYSIINIPYLHFNIIVNNNKNRYTVCTGYKFSLSSMNTSGMFCGRKAKRRRRVEMCWMNFSHSSVH